MTLNQETLRPLRQEIDEYGCVVAYSVLSPADDLRRGVVCENPHTVVPVIFVPGIMGSNLRDKKTKESIWNVDSTIAIVFQWIFRTASTRQSKLVADQAEVDDRGAWFGASATVSNEDVAISRRQGTISRDSYGEFVRWLDDRLSTLTVKGNPEVILPDAHPGYDSPWQPFVDGEHHGKSWNAQKPFEALSQQECDYAWQNFFCPVYTQGYNWLQSNGESGKALARRIEEIIDFWNHKSKSNHHCEKVILVTHSMGGLVARAAVHPEFGNAADKVLGIVHGAMPANGAAAAYHHCRSGYGGMEGWVLGRNAAQVTAVFANSPGAMELLPNHQYNEQAGWDKRKWLKVRQRGDTVPVVKTAETNPYKEIYSRDYVWWRLIDPRLIDPMDKHKNDWDIYIHNLNTVRSFHMKLGTIYHRQTYVHYGADEKKFPAYGDLIWNSEGPFRADLTELIEGLPKHGSDPVHVGIASSDQTLKFSILAANIVGYQQPGDGTVPACSGEAPYFQGGESVRQSFRLAGFSHQAAYDNEEARLCTLYSIGKLLTLANAY